jgi:hypothetical protein
LGGDIVLTFVWNIEYGAFATMVIGEGGSCVIDSETIRTVGVETAEGERGGSRVRVKMLENIFVLNFTTIEPSRSPSRMQLVRICALCLDYR